MAISKKSEENKRKLTEKAAERLAEILIMQVELSRKGNPVKDSRSNFKDTNIIPSQQNYDNRD